jgi:hypothetical protein
MKQSKAFYGHKAKGIETIQCYNLPTNIGSKAVAIVFIFIFLLSIQHILHLFEGCDRDRYKKRMAPGREPLQLVLSFTGICRQAQAWSEGADDMPA